MKSIIILLLTCVPIGICAEDATDTKCVENIEKEYSKIVDALFTQGREQLEKKEDIVMWLYHKNKEEFKDIKNLMSDLSIEVCFDRIQENNIKEQLKECLQEKIRDEVDKVYAINEVTAENVQDFFHVSRMICDVTQGSDDVCHAMICAFTKEHHNAIKKLKIIDKAQMKASMKAGMKIEKINKKERKKTLLKELCEHIVLGACPRK